MNRYTIYCTPEQTKNAFYLGAPLTEIPFRTEIKPDTCNKYGFIYLNNTYFVIPTAEQMIGWLRKEKKLFVEPYLNGECCYSFSPIVSTKEDGEIIHLEAEDDPDKATLAAIDAALEYLERLKQ